MSTVETMSLPVMRQRRVFISTPRHASQQESLYSCYLNTRACNAQFEKGFCSPRVITYLPEHRLFTTPQRLELHAVPIIPTVSPLDFIIPNPRPSAKPYHIEPLKRRMKNWAGTFFISHLPLPFALLASLALHRPMGFIPNHLLYLYRCTLLKLLPSHRGYDLCLSSSIV